MKLIALLLLVAIAWIAYRLWQTRPPARPSEPHAVDTVRCARCGVHVPTSHALRRGANHYCCPEHRDDHPDA